jgi:hypothetical protein
MQTKIRVRRRVRSVRVEFDPSLLIKADDFIRLEARLAKAVEQAKLQLTIELLRIMEEEAEQRQRDLDDRTSRILARERDMAEHEAVMLDERARALDTYKRILREQNPPE